MKRQMLLISISLLLSAACVFSSLRRSEPVEPDRGPTDALPAVESQPEKPAGTENAAAEPVVPGLPTPPAGARIAFVATGWSVPGASHEIFVMRPDGSGITSISNQRGDDDDPAWSPDGSQIAFTAERDGNREIYIMNADGTDPQRLTDHPASDSSPGWSPDGKRIVFISTRDNNQEIYSMRADGGDQTRLTDLPSQENYPAWSPDGKTILFSSFGEGNAGIYAMDADGSNFRVLMGGPLHNPVWSPDGTWIALDGEPHGCNFEVFVMRADGSEMRQVTHHPEGCGSYNKHPAWSPDGKQLIYSSSDRDPNLPGSLLMKIQLDGSSETALTRIRVEKTYNSPHYPCWSPIP